MGTLVWVEVLDRRGAVRSRVALDELPATVGRGYGNRVILDDRYVCPVHARLIENEEGRLTLEDLDSVNGIYLRGQRDRQRRVAIQSGTEVRVGHTRLRFVHPEAEVPAAVPDEAADSSLRALARSRLFALGALAVVTATLVLADYLGSYERSIGDDLVAVALGIAVLLALWAGVWALATRVVLGRFEFVAHLAVAAGALWLIFLLSELGEYINFLFTSHVVGYLPIALGLLLVTALLYGHLLFASYMSRRRRLAWSVGVILAFVALGGLIQLAARNEFQAFLDDPGALKPVSARWVPARTADDYIADLPELKAELDDLALER